MAGAGTKTPDAVVAQEAQGTQPGEVSYSVTINAEFYLKE